MPGHAGAGAQGGAGRHPRRVLPAAQPAHHRDIAIHDLAYAGGELWFVATAFSCLATWTPTTASCRAGSRRWSARSRRGPLPPERLASSTISPRYVTALGRTDEPGGWRAGKARDG